MRARPSLAQQPATVLRLRQDPALRARVRRDVRRGAVSGSRGYRALMAAALAEYRRIYPDTLGVTCELEASRRLLDGTFALRSDGSRRGVATRFGAASRKVA